MPRISCIIPAWNAERFIAEAVESVLAQEVPVDEIIVVDDGSSDATGDVARAMPGVTVISQENAGPAAARNRGLAAATGDIIAFHDADDLWMPGKLSAQLASLEAEAGPDLVFGMAEHIDIRDTDDTTEISLPEGMVPGRLMAALLTRRSVFDRVGRFDETMTTGADQDWLLRARDLGLTEVILPQLVLKRRVHGENLTLRRDREKRQNYMAMLERKLRERRAAGTMAEAAETWTAKGCK